MSDNEDFDFDRGSPLQEAAVSLHELYVTLRAAGFSRRDGLELIAKVMTGVFAEMVVSQQESDQEDEE
jgi:hypothetical protein